MTADDSFGPPASGVRAAVQEAAEELCARAAAVRVAVRVEEVAVE